MADDAARRFAANHLSEFLRKVTPDDGGSASKEELATNTVVQDLLGPEGLETLNDPFFWTRLRIACRRTSSKTWYPALRLCACTRAAKESGANAKKRYHHPSATRFSYALARWTTGSVVPVRVLVSTMRTTNASSLPVTGIWVKIRADRRSVNRAARVVRAMMCREGLNRDEIAMRQTIILECESLPCSFDEQKAP